MAKATKISANLKRAKFNDLLDRNTERPLRINDTSISGFYLLVAKTGYGVWYLEKRISRSGKSAVTFRLGKAWGGKVAEAALNVTQAGRKANAWAALCEAGKDPRKEIGSEGEILRLTERERPKITLDELTAHYLKKPGLSATCVFRSKRPPNSAKAATLEIGGRRIALFILGGRFDQVHIGFLHRRDTPGEGSVHGFFFTVVLFFLGCRVSKGCARVLRLGFTFEGDSIGVV